MARVENPDVEVVDASDHGGVSEETGSSPVRHSLFLPSIALTLLVGVVLPFGVYLLLAAVGLDVSNVMALLVGAALLGTTVLIWIEGVLELRLPARPDLPTAWYPPASLVILPSAYSTPAELVEMARTCLRMDYPAPLQLVLPFDDKRLPAMRALLQEMATKDARVLPLALAPGASRDEALVAALGEVRGTFVGVFSTNQQPTRDSLIRSWFWLSNGYDAVQGHAVFDNAETSWVARTLAVESQAPGSIENMWDRLSGVNMYCMTDVLRHAQRQTNPSGEPVSTLRLMPGVALDRYLVTGTTAPTSLRLLWQQRVLHVGSVYRMPVERILQPLGTAAMPFWRKVQTLHLHLWRPVYVWLALQVLPLLLFWLVYHGADVRAWLLPAILLLAMYVLHAGPSQAAFAYALADPATRRHGDWFLSYSVVSSVFYTEFNNLVDRVAQVRIMTRQPDGVAAMPQPQAQRRPIPFPGLRRQRTHSARPLEAAANAGTSRSDPGQGAGHAPVQAAGSAPSSSSRETAHTMADLSTAHTDLTQEGVTDTMLNQQPRRPADDRRPVEQKAGDASPQQNRGGSAAQRSQTVDAAKQLVGMVEVLTQQLASLETEHTRALERIRTLEERNGRLRSLPAVTVPDQDVTSMQDLLKLLLENPHHIIYLARISEHAGEIAAMLDNYATLRREVQGT